MEESFRDLPALFRRGTVSRSHARYPVRPVVRGYSSFSFAFRSNESSVQRAIRYFDNGAWLIVRAVTIFRGAVSVAWLMKGTCGPKGDAGERERQWWSAGRSAGRWQGGWWNRGKKKEERIKRRVPVVLPIDNGFHLYNSTPRATLDPFCLFSLMLFYHPFARCVPRVTYRMPSTHSRSFPSPKFSPLLPPTETTLFASSLSRLRLCYQRRLRFRLCSLRALCRPLYRKSVRVFRTKLCLSLPTDSSHRPSNDDVASAARDPKNGYQFRDTLDRRRFRGEAFAAICCEKRSDRWIT